MAVGLRSWPPRPIPPQPDTLLPGYRPAPEPFFTAIIEMHDSGAGTRYVATAMHRDPEGRARHEGMGFFDGWGTALDQLVAHTKTLRATR